MKTLEEIIKEWILPELTLDWVKFSHLPEELQVYTLNFIVWVARNHSLISRSERIKCFERAKQRIQAINFVKDCNS